MYVLWCILRIYCLYLRRYSINHQYVQKSNKIITSNIEIKEKKKKKKKKNYLLHCGKFKALCIAP